MTPLDTVTAIYDAFTRGDIATIVGFMDDDVAWTTTTRSTPHPWMQPQHGPAGVAAFFAAVHDHVHLDVFAPGVPCVSGSMVLAPVHEQATLLATGKQTPPYLTVHVWEFGANGKVTRFQLISDWAMQEEAARS